MLVAKKTITNPVLAIIITAGNKIKNIIRFEQIKRLKYP